MGRRMVQAIRSWQLLSCATTGDQRCLTSAGLPAPQECLISVRSPWQRWGKSAMGTHAHGRVCTAHPRPHRGAPINRPRTKHVQMQVRRAPASTGSSRSCMPSIGGQSETTAVQSLGAAGVVGATRAARALKRRAAYYKPAAEPAKPAPMRGHRQYAIPALAQTTQASEKEKSGRPLGSCRTCRLTVRIVTSSSAAEGWMPTTESSCSFVTPILTATAKPCMAARVVGK